ncbi:MAG: hypothetical protein IJU35_05515 [Paludibacteraceae bacterium]|nr:hypothetical protein [Paludibacteraceae bacterium]
MKDLEFINKKSEQLYNLIRDYLEKNEVDTLDKIAIIVCHSALEIIEGACESVGVKNPHKTAINIVKEIVQLHK